MDGRRTGGFTLVEVMVAGAIFLLFCAGFFSVYLAAMSTQRAAVNHYRALCLARNRVQRARTMPYGSLGLLVEADVAG
ncbi:MAG: prepilin-type N-terminal cleavage/methylation domain-containing protein, partial [Kiritimatiellia bacterium]